MRFSAPTSVAHISGQSGCNHPVLVVSIGLATDNSAIAAAPCARSKKDGPPSGTIEFLVPYTLAWITSAPDRR
jgi:hypothetical protein